MNRFARNLSFGKKLMLAAAAVAAAVGPLGFGIVNAKAQVDLRNAPRFDVASVRLEAHGELGGAWDKLPTNGRWTSKHMGTQVLVSYAYGVSLNRVEGIPKALLAPDLGFYIVAKMPVTTSRKDFFLMMQSLLADRFKAVVHTEVRDVPANTIEVAKGGVKLTPASGQCVGVTGNTALPEGQHRCHQFDLRVRGSQDGTTIWNYSGLSVSMADLASELSSMTAVGLLVDDTQLSGLYDLDVKIAWQWQPCEDALENQSDWNYAVKTGWEQQAGLLIDLAKTKKRPATVVVVEHVELPTPN
jgi:uncharacterized protein (TIGR03435 family)